MTINGHDYSGLPSVEEYIQALERERCKIQVFQRELPLCLDLVTQTIDKCKQQLSSGTRNDYDLNRLSECNSDQTSEVPVLEEFIPIKRASSEEQESKKPNNCIDESGKKPDWLSSVQLWNQTPDPPPHQEKIGLLEAKRNGSGGAFKPFKKGKSEGRCATVAVPATTSSTAEAGKTREGKEEQTLRKTRRCWSPELHRRFLKALQNLGGSHVATPKQIRELMKVDGLTNDEVKSHLQKYRLHTRKPTPSVSISNNGNTPQTPQFVVVGGLWMPPEFAAMSAPDDATTTTHTSKQIYAPVAVVPPRTKRTSQENSNVGVGGCARSQSPAMSSDTATVSLSR